MAAQPCELDDLDILFRDVLRQDAHQAPHAGQIWVALCRWIELDHLPTRRFSFLEVLCDNSVHISAVSQQTNPLEWSLFSRIRIAL